MILYKLWTVTHQTFTDVNSPPNVDENRVARDIKDAGLPTLGKATSAILDQEVQLLYADLAAKTSKSVFGRIVGFFQRQLRDHYVDAGVSFETPPLIPEVSSSSWGETKVKVSLTHALCCTCILIATCLSI